MRMVCEECRKVYDYDRDEFCPRCGAYNQPNKKWTIDKAGQVVRVDGVNERNHKGSFVHKEVHREKAIRRAVGLDRDTVGKRKQSAGGSKKKAGSTSVIAIVIWFVIVLQFLRSCMSIL